MNINLKINQLIQQAENYKLKGQVSEALEYYQQALRIVTPHDAQIEFAIACVGLEGRSVVEDPEADKIDSFLRSKIVEMLREMGNYEDAYQHAKIALFLDRQIRGDNHNDTSASYHDLGLIEFERRKFNNSEKWFAKSDKIDNDLLNSKIGNPIQKNIFFRKLIRTAHYGARGHLLEAAQTALNILPFIENDLPDIIKAADALNTCAQNLQNICEHRKAKKILTKAITMQIQANLETHPQMGRLYSNMAFLMHELWDFEAAKSFQDKSLSFNQTKHDFNRKMNDSLSADKKAIDQLIKTLRTRNNTEYDIFLSFNTHDKSVVERLHDNLESFGLLTWIFWEMPDWEKKKTPEEILTSISQHLLISKVVVMIASGASITSRYVFEEIQFCISNNIPLLIWFPEGVRICPVEASTLSDTSESHLTEYVDKTFRPGVYSLFGFGLRENNLEEISKSIISWFNRINKLPTDESTHQQEDILTPTRLKPILVDQNGDPILDYLI